MSVLLKSKAAWSLDYDNELKEELGASSDEIPGRRSPWPPQGPDQSTMRPLLLLLICVEASTFRSGFVAGQQDFETLIENSLDKDFAPAEPRGPDSCEWKGAPKHGYSFTTCPTGICPIQPGSFKHNGTVRFTWCRKKFTLTRGSDQDLCNKGSWTSSSHECVLCGKSVNSFDPDQIADKIIAGHNSSKGDFPWMTAIYTPIQGRWAQICGGTLVSPNIVLTAAHCLSINGRDLTADDINVGVGKLLQDYYTNGPGSSIIPAREIVRPERYVGISRSYDLDIGLVVLSRNVVVYSLVMPACIDWHESAKPSPNETGLLAGWGLTESGSRSSTLKWAFQKYVSYERCRGLLSPTNLKNFTPDKFCALDVDGALVDKGDSGGGLTFMRDGTHYVYGVVSTKIQGGNPNVRLYTNVMNEIHLAWLRQQWRRLHGQQGVSLLPHIAAVLTLPPAGGSQDNCQCVSLFDCFKSLSTISQLDNSVNCTDTFDVYCCPKKQSSNLDISKLFSSIGSKFPNEGGSLNASSLPSNTTSVTKWTSTSSVVRQKTCKCRPPSDCDSNESDSSVSCNNKGDSYICCDEEPSLNSNNKNISDILSSFGSFFDRK